MVKTALVGPEIERGAKLVGALDRADFKLDVALWAVLPEYDMARYMTPPPARDSRL